MFLPTHIQHALRRAASPGRCSSASLLVILTLMSCSEKEEPLPEAEEIRFTTQLVESASRSTLDSKWSGGEEVVVKAGSHSKTYLTQANGDLTAGSEGSLYWTRTDTLHISGYYAPTGRLTSYYSIYTGQNQTDSTRMKTKMELSDVLYAPPTVVKYKETARLKFQHLTAHVTVTVKAEEALGISNMSKASIKFANQHDESGAVSSDGTVEQLTAAGSKTITPLSTAWSGTSKTAEALLVPQRVHGSDFITVTIQNEVYSYTPTATQPVDIQAGKQYTFNLTLTSSQELIISSQTISDWTVTEENISSRPA